VVLSDSYRDAPLRAGIDAVYIEDDASAGIVPKPTISDETRAVATRAVAAAHDGARRALDTGRPLESRTLDAPADVVARILREIESSGEEALALADLSSADADTFQHSIDVTVVGLLLGQRLFRERGWVDYRGTRRFSRIDERLSRLGMGLLGDRGGVSGKPGWTGVARHRQARGADRARPSTRWRGSQPSPMWRTRSPHPGCMRRRSRRTRVRAYEIHLEHEPSIQIAGWTEERPADAA